jgi:hypothetical protein
MITQNMANILNGLKQKRSSILKKLKSMNNHLHSFECKKFISGLHYLQKLHERLTGII